VCSIKTAPPDDKGGAVLARDSGREEMQASYRIPQWAVLLAFKGRKRGQKAGCDGVQISIYQESAKGIQPTEGRQKDDVSTRTWFETSGQGAGCTPCHVGGRARTGRRAGSCGVAATQWSGKNERNRGHATCIGRTPECSFSVVVGTICEPGIPGVERIFHAQHQSR
jgi:hypothetical protein